MHAGRTWRFAVSGVLLAAAALAAPAPATAATFPVTKLADTLDGACNSDCSLREAVQAANADATADEILLPSGTLRVDRLGVEDANATGDIDVSQDLTIRGAGAAATTIQSFLDDRVIDLRGSGADLRLLDATIAGGRALDPNYNGGGIRSEANGELSVERVVVRGNLAQGAASFGYGGGIYKAVGRLVVSDSAIIGNRGAFAGFGGGIFLNNPGASAELTNVTIAGNSATNSGGGIYSNQFIPVTMAHVTISGNDATTGGGGIAGDASAFRLRSSVVAGNTSGGQPNCTTPYAPASDGGNAGDATCGLTLPSDAQTLDPRLAPLSATAIPVAEPLADSPAIDRAVGACPPTDARGVARPQGAACDAGAAERPVAAAAPLPVDKTAPVGSKLSFKPRAFAAERRGASIAARKRARRSSRVSYRLTEAATVTFTVERRTKGRRKGKRCVTGKPARKLKSRRCTTFKRVKGSFTHSGKAGSNAFRFRGRIGNRSLKRARYRMVGSPRDAAQNRGKVFRGSFTIVKR